MKKNHNILADYVGILAVTMARVIWAKRKRSLPSQILHDTRAHV